MSSEHSELMQPDQATTGRAPRGTLQATAFEAARPIDPKVGVDGITRFPCKQCGARLEYAPGTTVLQCGYCGTENQIALPPTVVEELDYAQALADLENKAPRTQHRIVKCGACRAELEQPAGLSSFNCPFCGIDIIATTAQSATHILPGALLPFNIGRDKARETFRAWLKSRWFAPNALKREAFIDACFSGVYLPAWTYDSATRTDYTGQRGDAYYVTQTVIVNGKPQVRQVRKIRWSPASGTVNLGFDDVLVMATTSLPADRLDTLMPWDLAKLVPYDDAYLAGFKSEIYTVTLPDGFERAKGLMRPMIETAIRHDIGGDEQRITHMNTRYSNVTFKHVLLPVWLSAYRFSGKVYQFMVNARTGEVAGARPYSAIKIALFVLMCLAIIALIAFFASQK